MARPKKLPPGMQQRGSVYYACFRAHGQLVRKRLSSDFEAAKTILNDLRARADKQDFGIIDNAYSWSDLKKEFLRWAKQAIRNPQEYERDLNHFEAYCRVSSIRQITPEYVYGYREWRLAQTIKQTGRPVSPRTVNKEVGTLRNMLGKAVEWRRIGSNAIRDVKPLRNDSPRKQRRALTGQEVESIFKAAPAWLLPPLRMFATTGIRRTELVELLFSDIDFDRRCVVIRAEIAKNHKAREIPLDDDTLAMLVELRQKAADRQPAAGKEGKNFSADHVFVTKLGTPLRNNLLRSFRRVCQRAGIEGAEHGGSVDIHSLRVTFATLALQGGAAPKDVQAIMGHSTLTMTMNVYAKATEAGKRNAIAALPFAKVSQPEHVVSLPLVRTARASNSEAVSEATKSA